MKHVIQSVPFEDTVLVQLTPKGSWYLFLRDFVVSNPTREKIIAIGAKVLLRQPVLTHKEYEEAIEEYLSDYPVPT